jgi:hypothetical protein
VLCRWSSVSPSAQAARAPEGLSKIFASAHYGVRPVSANLRDAHHRGVVQLAVPQTVMEAEARGRAFALSRCEACSLRERVLGHMKRRQGRSWTDRWYLQVLGSCRVHPAQRPWGDDQPGTIPSPHHIICQLLSQRHPVSMLTAAAMTFRYCKSLGSADGESVVMVVESGQTCLSEKRK